MSQKSLTIGVVLLITLVFLLTNASLFFTNVQNTQIVMLIYSVMLLFVIVAQLATPGVQETEKIFVTGLGGLFPFFLGFFLTAMLLIALLIPGIIASFAEPLVLAGTPIGFFAGIIYAFIKAYIEEALFRDLLMSRIGIVMQAILFGVFHFAVLSVGGASVFAVLIGAFFLAALGYIWGVMKQFGGVFFSTGSHFAWNMHALGILKKIMGG